MDFVGNLTLLLNPRKFVQRNTIFLSLPLSRLEKSVKIPFVTKVWSSPQYIGVHIVSIAGDWCWLSLEDDSGGPNNIWKWDNFFKLDRGRDTHAHTHIYDDIF